MSYYTRHQKVEEEEGADDVTLRVGRVPMVQKALLSQGEACNTLDSPSFKAKAHSRGEKWRLALISASDRQPSRQVPNLPTCKSTSPVPQQCAAR